MRWLQAHFKILDIKYAGVDGGICKCVLRAVAEGHVADREKTFGLQLRVSGQQVNNEIKRIGFIRDRECPLELRVGDMLILYISTALA